MKKFYTFNKEKLSYNEYSLFTYKRLAMFIISQIFISFLFINIISTVYNTPKEQRFQEQTNYVLAEFYAINNRVINLEYIVSKIRKYDSTSFSALYEYYPTSSLQTAYLKDKNAENYVKFINVNNQKIDLIEQNLQVQKDMFVENFDTSLISQDMIEHVPSRQPIINKNLKHTRSGYGYRVHPVYKILMFHYGIDFKVKNGTPIFCTGDGIIETIKYSNEGYGNYIIINHGYGYKSLYAHLSKINIKRGQEVCKNDVIALSGNSGLSTGPHLHYEVIKDEIRVNPINYFSNDLSVEEYEIMIAKLGNINSLD